MIQALVVDKPLAPNPVWPWLYGLAAAAVFGIIGAIKARRKWPLWALGGGALSFVTGAIAWGLANAMAVPYTREVMDKCQLIALGVELLLTAIAAFLLVRFGRGEG